MVANRRIFIRYFDSGKLVEDEIVILLQNVPGFLVSRFFVFVAAFFQIKLLFYDVFWFIKLSIISNGSNWGC